jgi:hypothetical protein
MHQEDVGAAVPKLAQGRSDLLLKRRALVIADPGLEEIAEDIELIDTPGFLVKKCEKRLSDIRA